MHCIHAWGPGYKSVSFHENVTWTVKHMGRSVPVEYVTDMQKVMEYGVMRTTTRIVNEKISMGKAEKTEM